MNLWVEHWGGDFLVTCGKTSRLDELDGFIAEVNDEKIGLITYKVDGSEIEITSMNSLFENKGVGTSLVNEVVKFARRLGAINRVMLITTNDNMNALKFWQKRGFNLFRVYAGAVEASRKLKPGIPLTGNNGIPLRDEIELEMVL
jgi:GNAT superfamily N-acetyltransferase